MRIERRKRRQAWWCALLILCGIAADGRADSTGSRALRVQHDEASVLRQSGEAAKALAMEDTAKLAQLEADAMMEDAEQELIIGGEDDIGGADQGRAWGDGGLGMDGLSKPTPSQEMDTELAAVSRLLAHAQKDAAATVRRAYAEARLHALIVNWLEPMPL